ncbi:MAG: patatin-like phospholipase family protein [Bacteroidetes bacterium]|nr:patatin-like phospholipase family protein [Bacteroidota bacterium]
MNFNDIKTELEKDSFGDFLDEPNPGIYRAVYKDKETNDPVIGFGVDELSGDRKKVQIGYHLSGTRAGLIEEKARNIRRKRMAYLPMQILLGKAAQILINSKSEIDDPLLERISRNPKELRDYLYAMTYDRGVFSGFAVRNYFQNIIYTYMKKYHRNHPFLQVNSEEELKSKCFEMNFSDYVIITGVDLRIACVNNTSNLPVMFSSKETPLFPVVEAVSMSMNIPGAFKPVFNGFIPTSSGNKEELRRKFIGFFVDGGTINNLPIHAFNEPIDSPLKENILAFRLTFGIDPENNNVWDNEDFGKYKDKIGENNKIAQLESKIITYLHPLKNERFPIHKVSFQGNTFIDLLGNTMGSLMYFAEEGQIRTPKEKDQTIELYSYGIETLEFSPDEHLRKGVIKKAYDKVKAYFTL